MTRQSSDSKEIIKFSESKVVLYSLAFLTLVFVGRLNELHPLLEGLHLVWIGFFCAVTSITFSSYDKNSLRTVFTRVPGWYLFLLFVISFFSIWGGVWPGASFSFFKELGYRMLYFTLIVVSLKSVRGIEFFVKTITVMYTILVLVAIVAPRYVNERISVTVSYDPNDFALFLAICIPMLFFSLFVNNSRKNKAVFVVLFVLGVIVIIGTGSRGGILALFAGIFFMVKRFGITKSVISFLIIGMFTIIFVSVTQEDPFVRFETMFDMSNDYNMKSEHGRIAIWKRGIELMKDNPILGTGVGVYKVAEGSVNEGGKWLTAHNTFIQIGVEVGIPSMLIFLYMFFKSYISLDKYKERYSEMTRVIDGLKGAMIVYCVGSIFLSWAYAYILYLLLALIAVVCIYCEGDNDSILEHKTLRNESF